MNLSTITKEEHPTLKVTTQFFSGIHLISHVIGQGLLILDTTVDHEAKFMGDDLHHETDLEVCSVCTLGKFSPSDEVRHA